MISRGFWSFWVPESRYKGETHGQYDPTDKYHHYAPDTAMQSLPVPPPKQSDPPVCGEFCAPDNLRNSDL